MKIFNYKDFNECFIELNRYILTHPEIGEKGAGRVLINNMFVELESTKADRIDLGMVGYKKNKWDHLLRTYVDLEKLQNFYKGLTAVAGTTYSFDFKIKESGNGGCIKSIVFTRINRKEWSEAHVIWRTCQFENKFAADLILIARILNEAPNANIKKIYFHIPQGYQSSIYVSYLMEHVFNITEEDLPDHPYCKSIKAQAKWKNPEHRLCLRATTARSQNFYRKLLRGEKIDKVMYKHCKLPFTK